MKILVLCLLRLGDVIQQQALFSGLRKKHPGARIDVMVNRAALQAQDIITGVDNWIVFEREEYQQKVGIAEIPLLQPVAELASFFELISQEDYKFLYNFTHNRLSAFVAEAISAETKFGLVANGGTFHPFNNDWLSHLNQRSLGADTTPFQFAEMIAASFQLEFKPSTAKVQGDLILLQPMTSDPKKNWSLTNWAHLLENLRSRFPAYQVRVLGAPFEVTELSRHFSPDDLFPGNLSEVRAMLMNAALLITGDTSIKHLAAQVGTPIIELALGSSNPTRTGAYQAGAVILHSKVGCAPCSHSGRCRMMSHECAEALPENIVFETAVSVIENVEVPTVSNPLVIQTTARIGTEWVRGENDIERLAAFFDRTLWRNYLNHTAVEGAYSEFEVLKNFAKADIASALEIFAREQDEIKAQIEHLSNQLSEVSREAMDNGFDSTQLTIYRQALASTAVSSLRQIAQLIDFVEIGQRPFAHPLAFFGAVQKAITDLSIRHKIGKNLVQAIRTIGGFQDGKLRDSSQRSLETP